MPKVEKVAKLLPHDAFIEAISRITTSRVMCALADLIKTLEFLEGHCELIVAWEKKLKEMGYNGDQFGVVTDLRAQNKIAEAREQAHADEFLR